MRCRSPGGTKLLLLQNYGSTFANDKIVAEIRRSIAMPTEPKQTNHQLKITAKQSIQNDDENVFNQWDMLNAITLGV